MNRAYLSRGKSDAHSVATEPGRADLASTDCNFRLNFHPDPLVQRINARQSAITVQTPGRVGRGWTQASGPVRFWRWTETLYRGEGEEIRLSYRLCWPKAQRSIKKSFPSESYLSQRLWIQGVRKS